MNDHLPQWVLIFERIGTGSAVLIFTGAVLWKLIPSILKLLGAWRKQSDTVTAAIPRAEAAFERLITHVERVGDRLPAHGRDKHLATD
jgi:hypothetical protein